MANKRRVTLEEEFIKNNRTKLGANTLSSIKELERRMNSKKEDDEESDEFSEEENEDFFDRFKK